MRYHDDVTRRERLHQLLDDLPEDALPYAEASLETARKSLADPFWRTLAEAETTDEMLTDDDLAAIEAGWASYRAKTGISETELDRRLPA